MAEPRSIILKELIGTLDMDKFRETISSQEKCLEILANAKWAAGFVCRSCGDEKYCQGKSAFSRRCTRCKREESATTNTIFQHCRIALPVAFEIAYMVCSKPAMPASEISVLLEKRHMTCLNFKKRILQCLQSENE
jgi:hypothetical protein